VFENPFPPSVGSIKGKEWNENRYINEEENNHDKNYNFSESQ
jgi:hypothetical protein